MTTWLDHHHTVISRTGRQSVLLVPDAKGAYDCTRYRTVDAWRAECRTCGYRAEFKTYETASAVARFHRQASLMMTTLAHQPNGDE